MKGNSSEFKIAVGGNAGFIYLFDLSNRIKQLGIIPSLDQRTRIGANSSRNGDFDGQKYFNLEDPLSSEIFKRFKFDTEPVYEG
jgi:hypothetical protein